VQVQVERLTKRYGDTVAVDELSFAARPGRVTGFLGRNGAGKSTTLKVLVGLAAPSSGSATFDGRRYAQLDAAPRWVGALLEQEAYHPARTARNHLRMMAAGVGIPDQRCDEVLGLVGMADHGDTRVGAYSLGMRQRLGLACALLGDPPVLLLDEPGNGLDPQGLRWLRNLLRWRADQGGTVLVSSHQLAEVQLLADDLVVIDRGRLVHAGLVDELATAGVRVRTPTPGPLVDALEASGAQVERRGEHALLVTGVDVATVGEAAHGADVVLHELVSETTSLEDVFVGMTGDEDQEVPA